MPERSSNIYEYIVICLDCSRSMVRGEYELSSLAFGFVALHKLIEEKLKLNGNSAFAIVKFSDQARTVLGFTNNVEKLSKALESIILSRRERQKRTEQEVKQLTWAERLGFSYKKILLEKLSRVALKKSNFGYVLKLAIELITAELSRTRITIPRIIIISDSNWTDDYEKFLKLIKITRDLNIRIDTIKFGKISVYQIGYGEYAKRWRPNILKIISDSTNGRYYYFNDVQYLIKVGLELIKPNIKSYSSNSELNSENPIFLREIAADLLTVQELTKDREQMFKQMRGIKEFQKCLICFSDIGMISKASFYVTGRYCPNCNAPFHIYCLALWAETQKDKNLKVSRIFKCPHCYYLLKIPKEVIQMLNLKNLSDQSIPRRTISQRVYTAHAELTNISNLGKSAMDSSCPICDYIFEENQKLVQCVCGTLYHIDCFQKLWNTQCKDCGVKIKI